MTRLRPRRLALALILLASAACSKSTEQWAADLAHPDPFVRKLAAGALSRSTGADAKTALRALLAHRDDEDDGVRARVELSIGAIADAALVDWLREPALEFLHGGEVERCLSEALLAHRAEAIPILVARLRRGDQPKLSAQLLAPCGADALPPLLELLRDPDPGVRVRAAHALGALGPVAQPARAELVGSLADGVPIVRQIAVQSLRAIDPAGGLGVPELRAALDDPDPGVRGAAGPIAVLLLLSELESLPPAVRDERIAGLLAIEDVAVPTLVEELDRKVPGAPRRAFLVLQVLAGSPLQPAEDAADWVDRRIERLAALEPATRARAAFDLARAGSRAAPAAAALTGVLGDPSYAVRICAAFALGRIGPAASSAGAELDQLTADPSPLLREIAKQSRLAIDG